MYSLALTAHSYLRWLVLAAALVAVIRAVIGLARRRPWAAADATAARVFVTSLDVQLLVGLILYVALSPFTTVAWSDPGAAMRDAPLRFMMIEHPFGMLIALVLAHIGAGRVRRTQDLVRRHKTALIFFGLALAVTLISTPWPGMPAGRPLLRGVTD
jgi:membrane-associated PAP2 superfamily phosphatase